MRGGAGQVAGRHECPRHRLGSCRDVPVLDALAAALEQQGFSVDRRKIHLDEPIKTLGEFTVPVRLYRDVVPKIKVVVEKEAVEVAEET